MIEDIFNEIIDQFNEKAKTDEKLKAELAGITKKVVIKLVDGRTFNFMIAEGQAGGLKSGLVDAPDIEIESDEETIMALYRKEMRAMKALALKKVRVKGSIEDLLRLRKFF